MLVEHELGAEQKANVDVTRRRDAEVSLPSFEPASFVVAFFVRKVLLRVHARSAVARRPHERFVHAATVELASA